MKNAFRFLQMFCMVTLLYGVSYGQSGSDTTNLVFNSANFNYSSEAGEKIDLTTGRLSLTVEDLRLPGRHGLDVSITRYYKSRTNYDQNAERVLSLASTLGIGWQCYIANYWDLRGSPSSFKGILYWKDGSNYTFCELNSTTLVCREKPEWRIIFNGDMPILITEDGTRYAFGAKPDNPQIHFKPVIQIKDVHGNYISLSYKPGTADLDSIVDTGKRVIRFHWSNCYYIDNLPVNKLDSIIVTGFENYGSTTYSKMKVNYTYTYQNFFDLENCLYQNTPCLAKVSKTLWVNYFDTSHVDIVGYQYGNPAAHSSDSADVGQLTRIVYPSGGYIQYHYWATELRREGLSKVVWVALGSKGYSNLEGIGKDALLTYEYLSRVYSSGGQTGGNEVLFSDYPYFDKITVKNNITKEYKINHYGKSNFKSPLDSISYEYNANGNLLRFKANEWEQPSVEQLSHLLTIRSPRLLKEVKCEYGLNYYNIEYRKEYQYTQTAFSLAEYNYNNVMVITESNSKDSKKRKTAFNYLHDQQASYLQNNILNKTTLKTILDGSNNIIAIDSSEYDGAGKISNNFVPANYEPGSSLPCPGDLTASLYSENGSNYIKNKYFYDNYGNMVKHQDPLENVFTYNYGVIPLVPYQVYHGIYLLGKYNPEYGLTKGYDYHPLTGWVKSTYEYAKKPEESGQTALNMSSAVGSPSEINVSYGGVVLPPPIDYYVQQNKYTFDALGRLTRAYFPDDFYSPTNILCDEPSLYYEYHDRGINGSLSFDTTDPKYPCVVEHKRRDKGTGNEYSPTYYVYDPNGRLVQTQRPVSVNSNQATLSSTRYENHGLKTSQSKPYFETLAQMGTYSIPAWNSLVRDSFAYDASQRLVLRRNSDGTAMTYAYNVDTVAITDENGNVTKQGFDPFGNLSRIVDANGQTAIYSYDLLGRLTETSIPGVNNNKYFYDYSGRLWQIQNPDLGGKSMFYDAAGNLIFAQDGNGVWTYYRYDQNHRLLEVGKTTDRSDPAQYSAPATVNYYDDYTGLINETVGGNNDSWVLSENLRDSVAIVGIRYNIVLNNNLLSTTVASGMVVSGWAPPANGDITLSSGVTDTVILNDECFYDYPYLKVGTHLVPSSCLDTYYKMLFKIQPEFAGIRTDEIENAYICLTRLYGNENGFINVYRLPQFRYYSTTAQDSIANNWYIETCTWQSQPADGMETDTGFWYDAFSSNMYSQDLKDSFEIGPWVRGWLNNDYYNNGIMLDDHCSYAEYWSHTSTDQISRPYLNYCIYDTIPCTVTATLYSPDENSITIRWHTDEPTTGEVQFSTDKSYIVRETNNTLSCDHMATIEGLLPSTVYNLRVMAVDRGKNETYLSGYQFKTLDIQTWRYYSNGQGRLTATASGGDTTVYLYDVRGRLTATELKRDGRSYLTKYGYDCQNNLLAKGTRDLITQNNWYNDQGQLNAVQIDGQPLASYSYTAAGACSTEALGNGVNSIYSYYPRQWLKTAAITGSAGTIFSHAYQYDANGNLAVDQDNTGLGSSIDRYYSYDPLNRLVYEGDKSSPSTALNAVSPLNTGYAVNYQYDARGNRFSTGSTLLGLFRYSYYPGTNRLQTVTNPDGSLTTYEYDGNGNTVSDGRWQYDYDFLNRQSRVYSYTSASINNINYTYNAAGLRTGSVNNLTQYGSGSTTLSATFPEPYEDLVEDAPSGDGHDDARDMGTLKVHVNDNFLFFEITHKYLYGTSQGNYENIYIALDTDQKFGSGAEWLPDDIKVRVTADNAWERCIVIYGEKDFGICTAEGFRLEKLETEDGKKMKVNYTNGRNSKAIIKVPVALLGNPEKIRFVIVSTMPGAASYKISTACDVLPGGKKSIDAQLLTAYNEYTMPLAPGAVRSTTTTEGFLYDNDGNLMADLDGERNITKRYIYGLGGKHLAMQINNTGYGPYSNACDDTLGFFRGGDSSPITLSIETADKQQGAASVQVNVDASGYGNFSFPDQGINFSASNYRWVHIWVKPLTEGSWVSFHCWDSTNGSWRDMNGDKNGDKLYSVNEDLELNQWNELWVDLDRNVQGYVGGTVRGVHMHASPGAVLRLDGIYTCSRDWKTFYYHTDYLNSPRAMTDQSGAVVWRQDYLAFGSEAGTVATGNTHKFTGHIQDGATGQYYAKARYFTPNLGRMSQPDPELNGYISPIYLFNPQLLNPYTYCINNPLKFTDPSGRDLVVTGDEANSFMKKLKKATGLDLQRNKKSGKVTVGSKERKAKGTSSKAADRLVQIINDSKHTANINASSNIPNTLIDAFVGAGMQDVDMSDVNALNNKMGTTPGGAIMHAVEEAYQGALNPSWGRNRAHDASMGITNAYRGDMGLPSELGELEPSKTKTNLILKFNYGSYIEYMQLGGNKSTMDIYIEDIYFKNK